MRLRSLQLHAPRKEISKRLPSKKAVSILSLSAVVKISFQFLLSLPQQLLVLVS
jgi:hypothetical protein